MVAVFVLAFLGFYWNSAPVMAQGSSDTEKMIRTVADGVLKDATFHFVDPKSGKRFTSSQQAPVDAPLRPKVLTPIGATGMVCSTWP